MISVKNITKRYGNTEALCGVSFEIKQSEIVGFLGPNGAGKTTMMKILTCFMPPTSGQVRIASMDPLTHHRDIRAKIGYLPENTPLYEDATVFEYLRFLTAMHRLSPSKSEARIHEVLESCGLSDKRNIEIGTLSKGYRQRVGLAQALIHDPSILILDEPTSGLDPNQIVEIRNLIKAISQKKTIILSTHILSEVEATCNRVLIIHKGVIVGEGTPQELRNQASNKTVVHVDVEGPANPVMNALKGLEGVLRITKLESHEHGIASVAIETSKGSDMRKRINHYLLDKGFELVGMQHINVSMEDVFTQLTRS